VACQRTLLELLQSVWHIPTYTSETDIICFCGISAGTSRAVMVPFFGTSIYTIRLTNLKYFDPAFMVLSCHVKLKVYVFQTNTNSFVYCQYFICCAYILKFCNDTFQHCYVLNSGL
jgi:hypothetical protein